MPDDCDVNVSNDSLESMLRELEKAEARVDVPMLVVTKNEFFFTGVPKHYGDDMALTIRRFDIADLDKAESVSIYE